ncbi:hypothetical protein B0J12DRAFT_702427 [Macrophomina phaseolina]|uniref:SnoaL-like domain-containing protein n=1 Tax=Macrophomina phaseolina TaxID=35725 RepID=A0ABQ8G2A8_9PEZI|nr:hypothetical protein B0J12DRAFT_702427 [Macrophomina phaseolina]
MAAQKISEFYTNYLAAYNAQQTSPDAKARFYTEDAILYTPESTINGRDAIMEFFKEGHKMVKEELRPRAVLEDDSHIFCELDAAFVALEDTPPNFVFKDGLAKGESVSHRSCASYTLRGGKIATITLFVWQNGTPIEPF